MFQYFFLDGLFFYNVLAVFIEQNIIITDRDIHIIAILSCQLHVYFDIIGLS